MNFLAHYQLAMRLHPTIEPQPAYIVGTALPDLLPLAAPHKRLRLINLLNAPASTPPEQAITEGVRVHLLTDSAFHNTTGFHAAQTHIGELVTQAGFVGIRVRRFFLAHVLVELALDAVLLRRESALADEFYEAFAIADLDAVSEWVERTLHQPIPALTDVLTRFRHSQYLRHYAEDAGVAEGLSRLSLRARQDGFQNDNRLRLVELVSKAITAVAGQTEALLSETASMLSASYPPTTEK